MKDAQTEMQAKCLLQRLWNESSFEKDEVVRIIVDLFLAAADTVSYKP